MKDVFEHEEDFHAKDRKSSRKEKKLLQALDRSKYKKTDQEKKTSPSESSLKKGRVISLSGQGIEVIFENQIYYCTLKGSLKKERSKQKNLVVVGDFVRFQKDQIVEVEPRTSFLSRTNIRGNKEQLTAANVEYAVIFCSIGAPPLKPALIDRYLLSAEKGNIKPIVVINKLDLLKNNPEEKMMYELFLSSYEPLGIPIFAISCLKRKNDLSKLLSLLSGKLSVVCGQSGVGKTTFLNLAFGLDRKVGQLTEKTAKGSHTTTKSELIPIPGGGYCIDTPGVRSFGLWNLTKEQVIDHFNEIKNLSCNCKYKDCLHLEEPDCAVLQALEEGDLSPLRYDSYHTLLREALGGIDNRTKRKLTESI
jgi:ribosome biogenesis GTPase